MENPPSYCKGTFKSILNKGIKKYSLPRVDHQHNFIQLNPRSTAKYIDAATRQDKFNRDTENRAQLVIEVTAREDSELVLGMAAQAIEQAS